MDSKTRRARRNAAAAASAAQPRLFVRRSVRLGNVEEVVVLDDSDNSDAAYASRGFPAQVKNEAPEVEVLGRARAAKHVVNVEAEADGGGQGKRRRSTLDGGDGANKMGSRRSSSAASRYDTAPSSPRATSPLPPPPPSDRRDRDRHSRASSPGSTSSRRTAAISSRPLPAWVPSLTSTSTGLLMQNTSVLTPPSPHNSVASSNDGAGRISAPAFPSSLSSTVAAPLGDETMLFNAAEDNASAPHVSPSGGPGYLMYSAFAPLSSHLEKWLSERPQPRSTFHELAAQSPEERRRKAAAEAIDTFVSFGYSADSLADAVVTDEQKREFVATMSFHLKSVYGWSVEDAEAIMLVVAERAQAYLDKKREVMEQERFARYLRKKEAEADMVVESEEDEGVSNPALEAATKRAAAMSSAVKVGGLNLSQLRNKLSDMKRRGEGGCGKEVALAVHEAVSPSTFYSIGGLAKRLLKYFGEETGESNNTGSTEITQ